MGTVTYQFTCDTSGDLTGGSSFTATFSRSGYFPQGASVVSATQTFDRIVVYSSKSPYLIFDSCFQTNGFPQTGSSGSDAAEYTIGVNGIKTSFQELASGSCDVTVGGLGSTVKFGQIRSSGATLSVEYKEAGSSSTISLDSSSVEAGKKSTVSFSNSNINNVYHKAVWKIGERSYETTTGYGTSSASFTIPVEWVDSIPNATSGLGSVTVSTYSSDGFLGSTVASFTLQVPDNIVPAISSISASRLNNNVPSSWGIYVKNHSGVTLTANGASGSYGSTIVSYTFSGGYSGTQVSKVGTIQKLTASGTISFSVYATDSRGRKSNTVSTSISVVNYSPPAVTQPQAFRSNSSGSPSDSGTYIALSYAASYNTVGGKNGVTASCYYQVVGASSWTLGKSNIAQNTTHIIGAGGISTSYTYQVKIVVSDSQTTVEYVTPLLSSTYTMFFKSGGTGVGFGQECANNYSLEINPSWKIRYGNFQLLPAVVSNDPPSNPVEGLIWLCPV